MDQKVQDQKTPKKKKALAKLKPEELEILELRNEMLREMNLITKLMKERSKKRLEMFLESPQHKDYVHVIWKEFERANDAKDALIKELVKWLDASEEASLRTYRGTNHFVVGILDNFKETADTMKTKLKDNIGTYKEKCKYLNQLTEIHAQKLDHLKVINILNKSVKTILTSGNILVEILNEKREQSSSNHIKIDMYKQNIIDRSTELINDLKTIFEKHKVEKKLNLTCKNLSKKVEESSKIILAQQRKINTMIEKKNSLKANLSYTRPNRTTIYHLKMERADLLWELMNKKKRFKELKDQSSEFLKTAVTANSKVNETLEIIRKNGEKLLSLHSICRKLMTKDEKKKRKLIHQRSHKGVLEHNTMIMNFWVKLNRAESTLKALVKQRKNVTTRNRALQNKLEKIFQDMGSPRPNFKLP